MNAVFKIFLSMSVSGSLLILAMLLGKRFLKDKISRQWQYYIWLVVIMRLLLPFGPETNLLGKTYEAVDQALTQAAALPVQSIRNASESPPAPAVNSQQNGENGNQFAKEGENGNQPAKDDENSNQPTKDGENENQPIKDPATVRPLQDVGELLTEHVWLIWLMAALGLLIRKVTIYQGFIGYIKAGLTPVSRMEMLDCLSAAAEGEGIRRPIELCVNPLISSPLLIGFFHPCIVLPGMEYGEKEFRYIVLHELTHYKRRDMFYKWLVQFTVCLHWFNPLVHLMGREITKACEFSCDEAVLAKTGGDNARDYGKTLLDAMAAVGKYRENLGSVTLSENKQLLKERLGAIMKFEKPSRAVKMATAALTLCVTLGAAFVGVYTMGTAAGSAQAASQGTPSGETGSSLLSDVTGRFLSPSDVVGGSLLPSDITGGASSPSDANGGSSSPSDITGGASPSSVIANGSSSAPDIDGGFQLPFDPTGRPTLSLAVSSAAVNVLPAADQKISAEYNSDVYAVAIDGQGSDWKVSVSCKTSTNTNDETVKLYLPNVDYGNVSMSVDSGHLTCGFIRSGNIAGSFSMASVFLALPEGFTGAVAASVDSGYFQLVSGDDFRNTTATIIDDGDWGEIYKPQNFQENGNTFTYTEGTGANVIKVRRKGSGVMGIYTSDAFGTLNFPEEWKELWQDEWQGKPWDEDWWQKGDAAMPSEASSDVEISSMAENWSTLTTFSSDAERYYEANSLPLFEIEFSRLDEEEQDKWLDKIYADGKISYWGAAVGRLDQDCAYNVPYKVDTASERDCLKC